LCGNRDIQHGKRNKTWREGSWRDYFLVLLAALSVSAVVAGTLTKCFLQCLFFIYYTL
jgi:hypothetical protein